MHRNGEQPADAELGSVSWSDVPAIADFDGDALHSLQLLLKGSILSLLQLSPSLEKAFRTHYRAHAANVLKFSIYGLIALYLMVIVPVLLLVPPAAAKSQWLQFAVYPIGLVLMVLWLTTKSRKLQEFVEQALGVSLYVCLSGTIYCALVQGEAFFGHVAAYETIFIVIISFSVLRLTTRIALGWGMAAFCSALGLAWINGMQSSWLDMLLFFFVPVLICAINGLMLEFAARRDFVQTLYHQQEKATVLRDIAAAGNELDDINAILEMTLKLLCEQRGWIAGQASVADKDVGGMHACVLHITKNAGGGWYRGFDRLLSEDKTLSLAAHIQKSGDMVWSGKSIVLPGVEGPQGVIASRFGFPVKIGNDVVAVLEFFSTYAEVPTDQLKMLTEQIGHQLGHVFARKRRHQELLDKATHDPLTGLPNRAYLLERITASLARSHRRNTQHFCVLLLDLDRFKWINDSVGHHVADQLLVEMGQRLRRGLRPSDLVARLGSDCFAVLIEDVDNVNGAVSAAQRIQEDFKRPVTLAGHPIHCSGSIGIVLGGPQYHKPDDMLRDADIAVLHAKQRGRGGYVVFSERMSRQNVDRLRLLGELQEAVTSQHLRLFYQPIVSLADGVVRGFEALIRWQHPERGLIGPGQFIPIAEESSLIVPLTRWVLGEACRQLAEWDRIRPPQAQLSISINISAAYFAQESMPDEVLTVIQNEGVRPESLRLEITESQVMDNVDACMQNIRYLREKGVYVYIDDFGTGYSSLNYLASFNAKSLKIDQTFVRRLGEQERESAIIRTITLLGQNLGMDVIAEGIETEKQLACLQELGCEYGQGFLFAHPMPAEAAAAVIGQQLFVTAPRAALTVQDSLQLAGS